jgi:hypothetical protein
LIQLRCRSKNGARKKEREREREKERQSGPKRHLTSAILAIFFCALSFKKAAAAAVARAAE